MYQVEWDFAALRSLKRRKENLGESEFNKLDSLKNNFEKLLKE